MLTLQAILLTSCLLIVLGMVTSLMWLATLRVHAEQEAALVEPIDPSLDSPV
jgi:hypothetical protein